MLALAFPTKQIRQRVEGMSVEMQATRFQIRWLQFTSAFPHFCVKPLDVFKETSGESPAVFLETITRCFLTGSRDISSPDIILKL